MPYRIVKGEFALYYNVSRHVGSRPDGDSVWFKANDPGLLEQLGGRSAELNGGGFAQLRFEAIDALELHFEGSNHQLAAPTVAARDRLLQLLGFSNLTYAPNGDIDTSVRTCTPVSCPGYILTRNIDPFGRPVAFVFAGNAPQQDGANVWLTAQMARDSVNGRLMAAGHVYPAYYTGLPADVRDEFTRLADNAWSGDKGVWTVDSTMSGAKARNRADLKAHAIWPKFYRRLCKYFPAVGNSAISGFDGWLRADPDRDDELWIISEGQLGNMHDVVEVHGDQISMVYWPEDLVIVPR